MHMTAELLIAGMQTRPLSDLDMRMGARLALHRNDVRSHLLSAGRVEPQPGLLDVRIQRAYSADVSEGWEALLSVLEYDLR